MNYDALMFYLLNRLLIIFGMRVKDDDSVVYLHRIRNYTDVQKGSAHIVRLTDDVSKAFEFIKLDYDDYKQQEFKNIFDFTDYIISNCPYITVGFISSMEKEIRTTTERTELINQIDKFIKSLKIGHFVLRDFNFVPICMYYNLRESIVRNFFDTEDVHAQFIELKLRHQKDTELVGKYNDKRLVTWIAPLKKKPSLTLLFSASFINHATEGIPNNFPKYIVDRDLSVIKKEVLNFYYNIFQDTETYKTYCLEDPENGVVAK